MGEGSGADPSTGSGISSSETGPLLERGESISALDALLDDVKAGSEGRLVFVGGEAGVGKTALLRCFCDRQRKPVQVFWGACEPLLTPRPLGPFVDLGEALGGELEQLVATAGRPYEVATALLRELRGTRPVILVLEDVHWADEATLDVLTLLARRISAVPALVLASYRDDELDRAHQLRLVLGELVRRPGRLKLQPLSPAAIAELARQHGVDGQVLYSRTGGNPFFVTEVLAAGGERIPETVRDAVLARTGRLSAAARTLLEAVAIVAGPVDLWLLEELAGELGGTLGECLTSGVLTADHARVSFRHELARLAIEETIALDRRIALHRGALAALEARGDRVNLAALAEHAEAAGDREAVLRWAPQAADRAGHSGSHREAAAQYARALRFADGLAVQARADLLERRVAECWMTDQFDAAIEAQEEALECRRQIGDRRSEGDARRTLSRLMFFVGRVHEGEALAQQAVEMLSPLPPGHELAMAYANLSQRRAVLEELEEAVLWGNRALEVARALDDPPALVYALTNIGAAEFQTGLPDGRAKLEQALELALSHGLEDEVGRAYATIVRCATDQRQFEVARTYLGAGLDYCGDRGLDTWRLYLLANRGQIHLHRGRWDEAADAVGLVLRDPRSAPFMRGCALTMLGRIRARRGDPQASAAIAEERALAEPTGELARIGPNAAASAEIAWLEGQEDVIEDATEAALSLALRVRSSWLVGELACWRWRAGIEDDLPAGAAAEPHALSIAGEWSNAAELWRTLDCPYDAALALSDADDEDAVRQAISELRALGADPAVAIVTRRLRERGVRGLPRGPRRATRDNVAGLTVRELEVLALVADGLRNTDIAQRLVVSQKTVDHHVSAILRKLAARTRGEAVSTARRLGLLT